MLDMAVLEIYLKILTNWNPASAPGIEESTAEEEKWTEMETEDWGGYKEAEARSRLYGKGT